MVGIRISPRILYHRNVEVVEATEEENVRGVARSPIVRLENAGVRLLHVLRFILEVPFGEQALDIFHGRIACLVAVLELLSSFE